MRKRNQTQWQPSQAASIELENNSRVAVIGAGPAGSLFAYFILEMAERIGLDLHVDLYEARDFETPAPQGCNMCGGIISESLVQNLASEGVVLASNVIQRGIDSYVLHMDVGSVRIETPTHEARIGAVHRGSGPRGIKERKWASFDGHLLALATERGAHHVKARVDELTWNAGKPSVRARGGAESADYDLLVGAVGINSPTVKMFEGFAQGYQRPASTKTLIREYFVGSDVIARTLGSSMHVFLLNIPRLEFAAIIPKGDYVTMCLLGKDIDNALAKAFADAPEVRACMPPGWKPEEFACQCMPHINVGGHIECFGDRVLFIGDCGVARLYKDGIGAAYRTAKASARTAVFEGISAEAFRRHYDPACRKISNDNRIGRVAFSFVGVVQHAPFLRRAMLRMTAQEQALPGEQRWLSGILWDMFSGSAPYADIFSRMVRPIPVARFMRYVATSVVPNGKPVQHRETRS